MTDPGMTEPPHDRPPTKKLIEVAIPLEAINKASVREKSIRQGHPSTLHLWWSRKPLAACRAVLFAQLVDDPSGHVDTLLEDEDLRQRAQEALAARRARHARDGDDGKPIPPDDKPVTLEDVKDMIVELERKRLFGIVEDLVVWENSTNEEVLERARHEIRRCFPEEEDMPRVHDPFSGGASIPLEAQRLGMPSHASDLNPVAALIGKAMIELPPKFADRPPVHPGAKDRMSYRGAEGLAEDILFYARLLSEAAWQKIGHLYPPVTLSDRDGGGQATVLAWLWARTVASPNPAVGGAHIPLVSTFWLCKKPKKKAWVEPIVSGTDIDFAVRYGEPDDAEAVAAGTKAGRGANFTCLITGDAVPPAYVKAEGMAGRMGWKLMAIVAEGRGGRRYASPTKAHEEIAFSQTPEWRPDGPLSYDPRNVMVSNYGLTQVSDLFMNRQTIALKTFLDCIPEILSGIETSDDDSDAYRNALATYLAMGVSRLANRQSTGSVWNTGRETVEHVFATHALPMRWNTAEGNPFSTSSGNFIGQVKYLAKAVAALPASQPGGSVSQRPAQTVDFTGTVMSTDPPYYDNVPYANISDFFYVWLRHALKRHYPDLFQTVLVPKAEELVADNYRHGDRDRADQFFLEGMTEVLRHMAKQGRSDIPATIWYAFRQNEVDEDGTASKGWATFLQAVISAGYHVGATWPVRTELVSSLKKERNALSTSVVLSCRQRPPDAPTMTRSEFLHTLKRELPTALEDMQRANIAPVDLPQASIGPGIGIFSRCKAVLESDDSKMPVRTALQIVNRELDEFFSALEGEFDPETRFALNWFAQHGHDRGPFRDADSLARARAISVDSVDHAGIVESAAGNVRILTRDELAGDWDPATDTHLTVWECCQHLIRTLQDGGERQAAILLKKIGPQRADAVKDLAYRLHDIASKQKNAGEANACNGLIAVWPDLTQQAASIHDMDSNRQTDFNL
ncbi:MAG: DUF1156 domain-containing protein [Rhodospirillales bacterium]|nr:DUF1156 domain-containing protein [Rhodospirillales bacterium]